MAPEAINNPIAIRVPDHRAWGIMCASRPTTFVEGFQLHRWRFAAGEPAAYVKMTAHGMLTRKSGQRGFYCTAALYEPRYGRLPPCKQSGKEAMTLVRRRLLRRAAATHIWSSKKVPAICVLLPVLLLPAVSLADGLSAVKSCESDNSPPEVARLSILPNGETRGSDTAATLIKIAREK